MMSHQDQLLAAYDRGRRDRDGGPCNGSPFSKQLEDAAKIDSAHYERCYALHQAWLAGFNAPSA